MNGGRFDPLMIVQALNRRGVEYVVIGGYAGELHAAAVPPTRDIDVTPRATHENLGRLSQVLTDLGARIRTEGSPEGLPFAHGVAGYRGVDQHIRVERIFHRASRPARIAAMRSSACLEVRPPDLVSGVKAAADNSS